jgi:hypothetical protein
MDKPYGMVSPDLMQNSVQISQVNPYRERPSFVNAKKKQKLDPISVGSNAATSGTTAAPQGPEQSGLSPSGKMKAQKVRTSLLQ